MKKTIHRDLVFTAAEVKEAVIFMLRERDHQFPDDKATDVSFRLGENGASLIWSETTEH